MWAREHFVLDGGAKHPPTKKVCRPIVEYRDYGKTRPFSADVALRQITVDSEAFAN